MADGHPLDSPVSSALTTGQSHLAICSGAAVRFQPGYAVFAAGPVGDLMRLPQPEGGMMLMEADLAALGGLPPHPRTGVQMVLEALTSGGEDLPAEPLGDTDAAEMLALARLTEPGPFFADTWRLGPFIGVRRRGRLVAMAGERMRPEGFAEISGVCTHPDARGTGLASALIRLKAEAILARGETPFLHSWADNSGAIRLYGALGFRMRSAVHVALLGEPRFFAGV